MSDVTYVEAVAQAEHRVAIGHTDVYLGRADDSTIDWSKCIGVSEGGSHRLDIYTDVQFHFEDRGLTLRWYLELETMDANGHGHYRLDVPAIARVMTLLPPAVRDQFGKLLVEDATAVERKADEYLAIAQREYGMAAALRQLATDRNEALVAP